MTNVKLLKKATRNASIYELGRVIGIAYTTIYYKIKYDREFKQGEIAKLINHYKIEPADVVKIFFV